jgi:integrase
MPDNEIVPYRGKWALKCWIDGERRRLSLGLDATDVAERCPNYPAAQQKAADLEREIAQPVTDNLTDVYLAYQNGAKLIGKASVENSWKALKPFWGGLRVDQITRDRCEAYIRQRKKAGKADGTILKELSTLRCAVNWVNKQNPAVFAMPSNPPPRDRWLTEHEFFRLLEAASDWFHLVVFLHLAIATAGRKEAILEMKWEQVSWQMNRVSLGHKAGGKARAVVPMGKTLRAVLQDAYAKRRTEFVIEYQGEAVKNIKKAFASAVKKAGLKNVTPHDMRHTAAVWMAGAGVPMEKIAQYLGHSDSRITEKVYARFAPEHLADAAAALDVGFMKKDVLSGSKSGSSPETERT